MNMFTFHLFLAFGSGRRLRPNAQEKICRYAHTFLARELMKRPRTSVSVRHSFPYQRERWPPQVAVRKWPQASDGWLFSLYESTITWPVAFSEQRYGWHHLKETSQPFFVQRMFSLARTMFRHLRSLCGRNKSLTKEKIWAQHILWAIYSFCSLLVMAQSMCATRCAHIFILLVKTDRQILRRALDACQVLYKENEPVFLWST